MPADIAIEEVVSPDPSLQSAAVEKFPISAFVITYNEEDRLGPCLENLSFCDEVLIIDSFSTDRTLEVAARYHARVIQRPWAGYRDQKAFGLSCTKHEWVLNVDADEIVSSQLRAAIASVMHRERDYREGKGGAPVADGYLVSRVVNYLGRWWRLGGWYPEYRLRFFKKSKVTWGGEDPHERPEISGTTGRLEGELHHFTYRDMEDQFRRLLAHAMAGAQNDFKAGKKFSWSKLLISPLVRTFKFYILKKGYREGQAGIIVAIAEGYYTFMKYARVWELEWMAKQTKEKASL